MGDWPPPHGGEMTSGGIPPNPRTRNWVWVIGALAAIAVLVAAVPKVPSASAGDRTTNAAHLAGVFPNDMLGTSTGGYLLYSNGRITALSGAPLYGNGVAKKLNDFVGMVTDISGNGYYLVTTTGKYFSFGPTCKQPFHLVRPRVPAHASIVGAINPTSYFTGGFEMVSKTGRLYAVKCTF